MQLSVPDRYELVEQGLLGEGGMGRVLSARDRVLDVPVALKIVRPDLAADERFRKRFELEVRISARFHHPHIVPLHDYGQTGDGAPFLGLALADAGSFASLRLESPPWEEVLRLGLELLSALAHLHARDVLHRDLKPENVLLHTGEDGRRHVWLADLGLAGVTARLARRRGRTEGTPGYMAPEQALGLPREIGSWTDLYAVGVMLWELITGERPFADDETAGNTPLPPFRPRAAVPRYLPSILGNLLRAEPMARYDLPADVATELRALGAPTEAADERALPVLPIGTVAPSAPTLATGDDEGDEDEQSTLYHFSDGDEDDDGSRFTPDWNRPLPAPLPERVPSEPGRGATARASLPLFALREPPLVGRDGPMSTLWEHARGVASSGAGRVVLVVGEAGSGKSRLLQSLVRHLEEGGWAESVQLSYSRDPGPDDGYAGAARTLLRPWNETRQSLEARLRRRLARERGRLDTEVKDQVDALARWCGLMDDGEEPAPAGVALREVYRFLEARTWRRLACLVIDDAQWAREDGDGLAIPEALLQRWSQEEQPLLVLVALRHEDIVVDPVLRERVDELIDRGAVRVDLPRLAQADTEQLLQESLSLTPSLAARVAARCAGNPLFARQVLLEWADRDWLVDVGGLRFDLRADVDADAAMPADALALLEERVERLAEASGAPRRFRDAVHLAALSGRTVPEALLMSFLAPEQQDFARGCGLWVALEDRLEFDSAMLHQAASAAARARPDLLYLHRRLGRAWVRLKGELTSTVTLQAGRHAVRAGDHAFGMPHLLHATEYAWRVGRTADLDALTELGLRAVRDNDELAVRWHGDVCLWRGRAREIGGDAAAAADLYREAAEAFRVSERPTPRAEALLGLGWAELRKGDLDEAGRSFAEAIEQASRTDAHRIAARAVAGQAWVEQQRRNFAGAEILFTRAIVRLAREDDPAGIAEAQLGQAFVARRTGDFAEALAIYEEAQEAFAQARNPMGEVRASLGLATVARLQGEAARSAALLRQALSTAEELGATVLAMEARLGMGELARATDDHEGAREIYEPLATWAERNDALETALLAVLGLALCDLDAGDLDAAHEHASRAVTHLERAPGHWLWAAYRLVVATLLARRGDHTGTWKWLWSASEVGLSDTVDPDLAACLGSICGVAMERGWSNVLRLAGKLASDQLKRLGQPERARTLEEDVQQALQP